MVTIPAVASDVSALRKNPIIAYMSDEFTRPYPFSPTVVVDIEPVLDKVIDMLACHRSQFFDFLPYNFCRPEPVPDDPEGQRQFLQDWYLELISPLAEKYRDMLIATYGEERGRAIKFVEAFEQCEYGSPLTAEDVRRLFPFVPE